MRRVASGSDALRINQLVNKQADLPWPSEDHEGMEIAGSVGTTAIQAVTNGEYIVDGIEDGYIRAAKSARSRLTLSERAEVEAIEGRLLEV